MYIHEKRHRQFNGGTRLVGIPEVDTDTAGHLPAPLEMIKGTAEGVDVRQVGPLIRERVRIYCGPNHRG